jgi:hypothetical protein
MQANSNAAKTDFLPLWAGQGAPLVRDLPAARLIETLVAESRNRLPAMADNAAIDQSRPPSVSRR